jgi:2-oxoglutarate ferredoxin oxidoreductase subunit alpha
MNPAALLANIADLETGATVLVNVDAFDERNIEKAGYDHDPLEGDDLADFKLYRVPMTSLTVEATKPLGVKPRDAERSKNFFALGLLAWMFTRPRQPVLDWIDAKFASREQVRLANEAAFKLTASDKAQTGKEFTLKVLGTAKIAGREYQQRTEPITLTVTVPQESAEAK